MAKAWVTHGWFLKFHRTRDREPTVDIGGGIGACGPNVLGLSVDGLLPLVSQLVPIVRHGLVFSILAPHFVFLAESVSI